VEAKQAVVIIIFGQKRSFLFSFFFFVKFFERIFAKFSSISFKPALRFVERELVSSSAINISSLKEL
jgi:hypothetical protein